MSLFKRLTRVAKANMDELLRQFDDGESTFDEKVSELELAFRDAKAAAANYSISVRKMEEERDGVQQELDALDARAEEAIKADDEELARQCMNDRIRNEERLYRLAPALEESRKTYQELKENLLDLQLKLDQARAKRVELEARRQAEEARRTADEVLDTVHERHEQLDDEADAVLDEEIEAEARRQVKEMGRSIGVKVEKTVRDLQVDARLEELRKRMGPED